MTEPDDRPTAEPAPRVVLCDAAGRPTGTADLAEAHSGDGILHLAFSVYVFSPDPV